MAIELKRQIQQGAEYLEVNDVRSVHGREFKNIVEPIANNKTLKWVDKEKGLAYLSSASQPVQQEIDKQVLDTATKVVKDFVNPKVSDENVSAPKVWGKKDLLSKAEQVSHGIDPDLLFRDTIEDDDNTARETYNRMADEARSRIREAWQDSMINVRNLQEAVLKQRGEKLEDWEDAYNEENRSHGKSRAEAEYFTDNLYKPLLKSVSSVAKAAKVSVGDVTEYMMAKHGLERNEVFAKRDADAADTEVMRRKTEFGETKFSDGYKKVPSMARRDLTLFNFLPMLGTMFSQVRQHLST